MEEDILYEFRNIVEESRIEDNRDYYIKLRDTLDFMENLLTRYKELEEWKKEKGCSIQEVFELFIPKSKVKEKIEELDERIKNPERTSYWASYTISECIEIRRILQDLLGEE